MAERIEFVRHYTQWVSHVVPICQYAIFHKVRSDAQYWQVFG